MRIDVNKYVFVVPESQKNFFFSEAQKLGVIHFTPLYDNKRAKLSSLLETPLQALKTLKHFPSLPQETLTFLESAFLAENILKEDALLAEQREELRALESKWQLVRPLGEYSVSDLKEIENASNLSVALFCTKKRNYAPDQKSFFSVIVAEEEDLVYFLTFSENPISNPKWVWLDFRQTPQDLKTRIEDLKEKIYTGEKALQSKACYLETLESYVLHLMNEENLKKAVLYSHNVIENHFFVVSGFIPETKLGEVSAFIQRHFFFMKECSPEKEEVIPTCLENKSIGKLGQDLVAIYDTPSTEDKDPSTWVFLFFALFFAIIVGDAGYGAIFLLIGTWIYVKNPNLSGVWARALKLWNYLALASIVWGVLTHSYFGITLSLENPLHRFSFLSWLVEKKADYLVKTNNPQFTETLRGFSHITPPQDGISWLKEASLKNIPLDSNLSSSLLMELALLIGIIHISLSFLRYIRKTPSGFGWIIALWGGYFYFPKMVFATTLPQYLWGFSPEQMESLGEEMMLWGVVLALALSLYQHGLKGILDLMNVIQILSDVLSYLRLYALGLAGGIMSATINSMTESLPFLIGGVVLFAAHGVNMLLAVMGGVIHGLRLNFLEWYHYSFEGGGKEYLPLKILKNEES